MVHSRLSDFLIKKNIFNKNTWRGAGGENSDTCVLLTLDDEIVSGDEKQEEIASIHFLFWF